jgi:hypothetical protein
MSMSRVALLVALLALTAATSASAATFLRLDPFGTTLPAGSTLTNGVSDSLFISISGAAVNCTFGASVRLTVGASGGTLVTGTLTSLTFPGCCQKAPGTTVPVTLSTTDVVLHNLYLKCAVNAGVDTCYYRTPAATGSVDNFLGASLRFNSGVSFTHTAPPGATDDAGASCGTTGNWATRGFTQLTTTVGATPTRATVTTS